MGHITTLHLLTIAVFCNCSSIVHGVTERYVIPTEYDGTQCPGEPCHTLIHYASNIHNYKWSDVVVRFLPGNHSLNQSFYVSNVSNLQLTSFDPAVSIRTGSVSIHCTSEGNFYFKNTSNITITDLLFFIKPKFGMESGSLMFDDAIDFKIHQIVMQIWNRDIDDEGRNINIQNASGKSTISHSKFYEFNSAGSYGNHISISSLEKSYHLHFTVT